MNTQKAPDAIKGDRITLKRLAPAHAQELFDGIRRNRERLQRFLPWPKYINTVDDELDFIRQSITDFDAGTLFGYAISLNSNNTIIGTIGSYNIDWKNDKFEIGYWILGHYEGQGYVSEALNLLLDAHRSIGFHRAAIVCEPENARSKAVALKGSFLYEGLMRGYSRHGGSYVDMEMYSRILE